MREVEDGALRYTPVASPPSMLQSALMWNLHLGWWSLYKDAGCALFDQVYLPSHPQKKGLEQFACQSDQIWQTCFSFQLPRLLSALSAVRRRSMQRRWPILSHLTNLVVMATVCLCYYPFIEPHQTVLGAIGLSHRIAANSLLARSACPGINALANHGWLPHDGRNITYDMLVEAVRDGFGFDPPPSIPAFANMTFHRAIRDPANIAVHPENITFDLDTVNTHNGPIEFDGSLSRKDDYFGSDVDFDRPTWDTQWRLMEEEQEASGGTGDYFDLAVAARARARHVLIKSQAGNPDFLFTQDTLSNSAGTTALYMMVLSGMTKAVKKDWLWAFFGMFQAHILF